MKNLYHMLTLTVLLLFSACDVLDQSPLDEISNDDYWKTVSDLENYTLQFYPSFPTFRNSDGHQGNIGADGLAGTDHEINSVPISVLNGTRTIVNSGGNWDWTDIRSVNIFFENYYNVDDTEENMAQYVGEAHFFKAWYYFEKLRRYGDVPWYTNSLDLDSPELYAARTSRESVADSILAHLDVAIEKLTLLSDVSGGNNRLSKEAALLFKSRVALYEGTWQKYHANTDFGTAGVDPTKYLSAAVAAAEELMTGEYTVAITGSSADDYTTLFASTDLSSNEEIILWADFDKTLNTFSHNFQQYVTSYTDQTSITYELVRNYLGTDGKPFDYDDLAQQKQGSAFLTALGESIDPRFKQVVWVPGQTMWDNTAGTQLFDLPFLDKTSEAKNTTGFQLHKGADPKDPTAGGAQGYSTACETGAVIFRYAEALLNYAEAKAELGETVDYTISLDLLRQRVQMPDFEVQADDSRDAYADFGYTLTDELYEIRRERAVELASEGFRYDDWRRWRAHSLFKGKRPTGFPYLASEYGASVSVPVNDDGLADPFQSSLPTGYDFNEARDYLECIPVNEITLNPALTQNPGW